VTPVTPPRHIFLENSLALWHVLKAVRERLREIGGPYLPIEFQAAFKKAKKRVDKLIFHLEVEDDDGFEKDQARDAYALAEAGVVEVAVLAGDIVRRWATMPSLN